MKRRIVILVLALAMCLGIVVPATASGQTEETFGMLSITNVTSITGGIVENDYYWFEEVSGVEIFGYDQWVNEWYNPPDAWYYFIGISVNGEHDISSRIDNALVGTTYTVSGSTTITLTRELTWDDNPHVFRLYVDADDTFINNVVNELEYERITSPWDEDVVFDILAVGSQIHINGEGVYLLLEEGLPGPYTSAYLIIVEDDSDTPSPLPSNPLESADDWAVPELELAIENGLVLDDMFGNWAQPTSRLMAADVIVRLIETITGSTIDEIAAENGYDMSDSFIDTDSESVTFLKASEISNGVDGVRYDQDGTFTRAQMVTMLGRMAENVLGIDFSGSPLGSDMFSDVPDWASIYVGWAAQVEITNGVGGGLFDSDGTLQNQHTGVFAYRAYNYFT